MYTVYEICKKYKKHFLNDNIIKELVYSELFYYNTPESFLKYNRYDPLAIKKSNEKNKLYETIFLEKLKDQNIEDNSDKKYIYHAYHGTNRSMLICLNENRKTDYYSKGIYSDFYTDEDMFSFGYVFSVSYRKTVLNMFSNEFFDNLMKIDKYRNKVCASIVYNYLLNHFNKNNKGNI